MYRYFCIGIGIIILYVAVSYSGFNFNVTCKKNDCFQHFFGLVSRSLSQQCQQTVQLFGVWQINLDILSFLQLFKFNLVPTDAAEQLYREIVLYLIS